MCLQLVEPKRLERLSPTYKTGALPIELWPRYWWTRQELHLQAHQRLLGYSPPSSLHCSTHPVLAGRVGLEPTSISLTGRPPTDGAPANVVQRERFERSSPWPSTRRSTNWSYRCLLRFAAFGRLPGSISPHRYPDSTAVPLYSPSLRQAVSNNKATGPEPIQVLPHLLTTSQMLQTWSRWHGIEPATSCLQNRRSSPLSYTGIKKSG